MFFLHLVSILQYQRHNPHTNMRINVSNEKHTLPSYEEQTKHKKADKNYDYDKIISTMPTKKNNNDGGNIPW